jgi:hypothetical protein
VAESSGQRLSSDPADGLVGVTDGKVARNSGAGVFGPRGAQAAREATLIYRVCSNHSPSTCVTT